eukprot:Seg2859.3 transcript_id=Seg2859.3/GoldUCD/mRNA.D3Y31 product="Potassium voltage-gated channel subfamily B member 1" protein_id=Seg2859.3/GoldUCD/D3Y31
MPAIYIIAFNILNNDGQSKLQITNVNKMNSPALWLSDGSTYSIWVKLRKEDASSSILQGDNSWMSTGTWLVFKPGKGFKFEVYRATGTACGLDQFEKNVNPLKWNHIVVTFHQDTGLCGYVNGNLAACGNQKWTKLTMGFSIEFIVSSLVYCTWNHLRDACVEVPVMSQAKSQERYVKFETARLNVCGIRYEIRWETLVKHPETRLGGLAKKHQENAAYGELRQFCDGYDKVGGEFFFERDPTAFIAIMNYHITGNLHIPRSKCATSFEEEAAYWRVPFKTRPCCDTYYYDEWECTETIRKADQLQTRLMKEKEADTKLREADKRTWKRYSRKIWNLLENPETSIPAKIVSVISNLIVIASTLVLCLNTHPDLQHILPNGKKGDNPMLATIEVVCIIWFTIEFIARLISCPNKKQFIRGALNAIDILAILPYYLQLIFELQSGGIASSFVSIRRFIQILRIIRIVRIFKLVRHSTGLQVLAYTMKESVSELTLLALLLAMGVTLFATLVYYAEEHVPGTKFKSIIEALWWATVSMTTVGYGDMNPVTTFGKIIGCGCCVCGVLIIALPIPTIVGNFSKYYSEHQNKKKIEAYKLKHMVSGEMEQTSGSHDDRIDKVDKARRVSFYRSRRSTVGPLTFHTNLDTYDSDEISEESEEEQVIKM